MNFDSTPDLKTLEEFIAFYEKDTPENKIWLFKQYQYAMKERQRYKLKGQKRHQRLKKERHDYLAQHPEERKKPGRPRKNPPPAAPVFNTPVPGAGDNA